MKNVNEVEVGDIIKFHSYGTEYEVLEIISDYKVVTKLRLPHTINKNLEYSGYWNFNQVEVLKRIQLKSVENEKEYEGLFV